MKASFFCLVKEKLRNRKLMNKADVVISNVFF